MSMDGKLAKERRIRLELERLWRLPNGRVVRMQQWLEEQPRLVLNESTGLVFYNPKRAGAMGLVRRKEYFERLKMRKFWCINGLVVPKVVWDSVAAKQRSTETAGERG